MAHVEINGFDDVLKQLEKLADKAKVDDIAKQAVDSAREVVASATRSSLAAAEAHQGSSPDRTTGAVAASVISTPARINSYGAYSVAMPTGHHPSGKRNAEVAAYLNYGSHNMSARPWRANAAGAAAGPATKIIKDYVNQAMGAE